MSDQGIQSRDMSEFYNEFTPSMLRLWEGKIEEEGEGAEWKYGNKIKTVLPFVKKVTPRIARSQIMSGLCIIELSDKNEKEEQIVEYGLEPLLKANIVTEHEARAIVRWYITTVPTWEAGGRDNRFEKIFEIDGIKYWLHTDSFRNCRSLILSKR